MSSSTAYHKRWRLARLRGVPHGYVPAARVRAHLEGVLAAGATRCGLARVAGVSPQTVYGVLDPDRRWVQQGTARRLLAVTIDQVMTRPDPDGFVPAVGARRRIEALLAIGWRHTDITARMPGRHVSSVVLHQAGHLIARATHDAVTAAYDALSMTPGPSDITRARAARLGYVPPLGWDDDTIDDPTAVPQHDATAPPGADVVDHTAVDLTLAGVRLTLTRAERHIALAQLVNEGLSDAAIAERLGVTDRTILRDRQALGLATRWDPTVRTDPTRTRWKAAS